MNMKKLKILKTEKVNEKVKIDQSVYVYFENKLITTHKVTRDFILEKVEIIEGEKDGKYFIGAIFIGD